MQKRRSVFKKVITLTTAAMLTALSIVIGIFCKNSAVLFGAGRPRAGDAVAHGIVRPADAVFDDTLYVFVVKGGVVLVTGLEVEDASVFTAEGHARAEDLAARKPTEEDHLIGFGNGKGLAVHLFVFQFKVFGNARRNGMAGGNCPDTLTVAFSPMQVAGRSHEFAEDLGVVTRMQREQSHAVQHPSPDSFHHVVGHQMVSHVSPPQKYVCFLQHLFAKTTFEIVKGHSAYREILFGAQKRGDGVVNAQDALAVVDTWLRKGDAPTDDTILTMNVNGDSRINTFDALGIVEAFVNKTDYIVVTKAATITENQ